LVTRQSSPQPDERGGSIATVALETWRPPTWLDVPGDDPARAFVVGAVRALVDAGQATWAVLEGGDVRVTCSSGVVLHLTEDGVIRIR
jgi:hypothetical protein